VTKLSSILAPILNDVWKKRNSKNKTYSMRAFARDLQIDSSSLAQFLNHKRQFSLEKCNSLVRNLGLSAVRERAVLSALLHGENVHDEYKDSDFLILSESAKELMSSWLCYTLLSAMELKDFKSDVRWFAKRLKAPVDEVAHIFNLLESHDLISRKEKPWKTTGVRLSSGRKPDWTVVKAAMSGNFERFFQMFNAMNVEEVLYGAKKAADVSASTISIDVKKLPEAFQRINEFRRDLAQFLSGDETCVTNDEVYRLQIQLFPLSH
jgi:uncharacterized protein (TIGR02147 family)